jgi:16S rRNA (guanine966-N2)-methyltransferase
VVKEAVFNMLGPAVARARVLDLFAGSGALGIEALSRGAAHATFVERDPATAAVIRRNLETLGLAGRSNVATAEAVRWLERSGAEVADAAVVLLDPPYNDAVLNRALALLDELVSEGATTVVEHAPGQPVVALRRLRPVRERRYGDSAVLVLRAGPPA